MAAGVAVKRARTPEGFDAAVRIFCAMVPAMELQRLGPQALSGLLELSAGAEHVGADVPAMDATAAERTRQRVLVFAELAVLAVDEIDTELTGLARRVAK
jgi:hypothetical protein